MKFGKKLNTQGSTFGTAMLVFVWMALIWPPGAFAMTLDEVSFAKLPGNRVQIKLTLSDPVDEPLSFAIDNPARVALDFPGVSLNLDSKRQTHAGIILGRDGTVYRVQVGNYMGQNYGKIIAILEDRIELEERARDTRGKWQLRDASLALAE